METDWKMPNIRIVLRAENESRRTIHHDRQVGIERIGSRKKTSGESDWTPNRFSASREVSEMVTFQRTPCFYLFTRLACPTNHDRSGRI